MKYKDLQQDGLESAGEVKIDLNGSLDTLKNIQNLKKKDIKKLDYLGYDLLGFGNIEQTKKDMRTINQEIIKFNRTKNLNDLVLFNGDIEYIKDFIKDFNELVN